MVWIEVVHPEEEALLAVALHPALDRGVHPMRLALQEAEGEGSPRRDLGRRPVGLVVVVVGVEALVEVDLGV